MESVKMTCHKPRMQFCSFFAQIHHLQSDVITKKEQYTPRTVYPGASPQRYFITVSAQLYHKCYCGRRATPSIGDVRGVYTGQLVYYGRRATLSVGDIFAGSSKAPPSTTPPPERPGTTPSSSAATSIATPPPWHLGTTPSSPAITLTTAYEQETPPAKGGAQRTTAQSTTYDAHRRLFSFGSSNSSARAACTISSTLDNLWLDITL